MERDSECEAFVYMATSRQEGGLMYCFLHIDVHHDVPDERLDMHAAQVYEAMHNRGWLRARDNVVVFSIRDDGGRVACVQTRHDHGRFWTVGRDNMVELFASAASCDRREIGDAALLVVTYHDPVSRKIYAWPSISRSGRVVDSILRNLADVKMPPTCFPDSPRYCTGTGGERYACL